MALGFSSTSYRFPVHMGNKTKISQNLKARYIAYRLYCKDVKFKKARSKEFFKINTTEQNLLKFTQELAASSWVT